MHLWSKYQLILLIKKILILVNVLILINKIKFFFFYLCIEASFIIQSIKFKKEYTDFAKMVADYLGDFNAIHLRLTDHKVNFAVSEQEFDDAMGDLVAYLQWMGEPAQLDRKRLGVWVLMFLAIFTVLAWGLNKSYWKDIH